MKKILTTLLLIIGLSLFAHTNGFAQQHGPTKLGAAIVYGSEVETAGIQLGATFRVSPQFAIAPDIGIYFPDDDDTPRFIDSFFTINLNGHYIFEADDDYHIYALGGLNVSTIGFDSNDDAFDDDSESELGLNLGLGGEYHLDNLSLFSELKYIVSDFDQVVLAAGVRFPLN
jgi:hypothetical protein